MFLVNAPADEVLWRHSVEQFNKEKISLKEWLQSKVNAFSISQKDIIVSNASHKEIV